MPPVYHAAPVEGAVLAGVVDHHQPYRGENVEEEDEYQEDAVALRGENGDRAVVAAAPSFALNRHDAKAFERAFKGIRTIKVTTGKKKKKKKKL